MPLSTFGRGRTSVVDKVHNLVHGAIMGSSERHRFRWREQGKRYSADQGTERGVARTPFVPAEEVQDAINAVDDLLWSAPDSREWTDEQWERWTDTRRELKRACRALEREREDS